MRTALECIPCIMQQAYNTVRRATEDPAVARRILEEVALHVQHLDFDAVPADNSNFVYRTAAALTGCTDPYATEKRFYNERLMALLPGLREIVEGSTDPLRTAVRLAIAGNSIDLGIGYEFDLEEELRAAIDSPLLEMSIHGAQGILFNITGGNDLSMFEVDEAARIITEASAPEANIIFGAVIDEAFTGQIKVTVVATGFSEKENIMTPAAANPAQRLMKSTFSRPASEKDARSQSTMMDPNVKSTGPQLNEEELEVPAFMRKPLSK